MLSYNIIKHWRDAWLCKRRIGEAHDGLKPTIKYSLLLLNIAKLLVLYFNGLLALSNRQKVAIEMAWQLTGAERYLSGLVCPLNCRRLGVVVATCTLVYLGIEDPSVTWTCIEQASNFLWWRSDKYVCHVRRIMVVKHHEAVGVIILLSARILFLSFVITLLLILGLVYL